MVIEFDPFRAQLRGTSFNLRRSNNKRRVRNMDVFISWQTARSRSRRESLIWTESKIAFCVWSQWDNNPSYSEENEEIVIQWWVADERKLISALNPLLSAELVSQ